MGGVTRCDFLLSFLLRAVVRDQPCKVTLGVPVTGPGTMLALWGAGWQHWLHRPQSWPKFNSGATAKQLHLTGCRTAQLWAACHGSIWSEPCSLRYHTAHSTTGTPPLTNKQLPQAEKIQKKWEENNWEAPVQSGQLLQLFSWDLVLLIYGGYRRRWKKIFHVSIYRVHKVIPCDSSTGPKKR